MAVASARDRIEAIVGPMTDARGDPIPATEGLQPGVVVEVAPGVKRLIAPNPGLMTGPGTNTYLVGDHRVAIIDPGPDDDAHLDALLEAVGDRLRWIMVTHTHRDHAPLSARLKNATGAEIIAFGPAPARRLPASGDGDGTFEPHDTAFAPDRLFSEGDRLEGDGFAVDAVYTPGHTSNHLCFELVGTNLLFSGDHVMSGSTVVIAPPDGDMTIYLESLEKIRGRRLRRIAPGHGGMIEDPASVLDDYLRHRRAREGQILACLRTGGAQAGTGALVKAIYTDIPEKLEPMARLTVWAHLRKLGQEGKATSSDPDDPEAKWSMTGGDRQPPLTR